MMKNPLLSLLAVCWIAPTATAGTYQVIHNTPYPAGGQTALAGLTAGADGNYYGTTVGGGANGEGTFFRMSPSGQVTNLTHFSGTLGPRPGSGVGHSLILGSDGKFYGASLSGGFWSAAGVLYRISPTGTYEYIMEFDGGTAGAYRGNGPKGLTTGPDGHLYGCTSSGGANGKGTFFKYVVETGAFTTIADLPANISTFGGVTGPLTLHPNGLFYGMTTNGGSSDRGLIISISTSGTVSIIAEFTGTVGARPGESPVGSLVVGQDGLLYGCTDLGGSGGFGTVFRISTSGAFFQTLVNMDSSTYSRPTTGPSFGADGALYVSCFHSPAGDPLFYGGIVRVALNPTITLSTAVAFTGNNGANRGQYPRGQMLAGPGGILYGVTSQAGQFDSGTIFSYQPSSGTHTVLHDFDSRFPSTPAPSFLRSGFMRASNGKLYAVGGGGPNGQGVIYSLTPPSTTLSILAAFNGTNGANPGGDLAEGPDGSLYGTCSNGFGAAAAGTIFRCTPEGVITVLKQFGINGTEGGFPSNGLTFANGAFYGSLGDQLDSSKTILFKITPEGTYTELTRIFGTTGATRGQGVSSRLVLAPDGNLYGSTASGGFNSRGVIFRITSSDTYQVVTDLTTEGGAAPGAGPRHLSIGPDGLIYGVTSSSFYPQATLFKMSTSGTFTRLLEFSTVGWGGEIEPDGPVAFAPDGSLYGTTRRSGVFSGGMLFHYDPTSSNFNVLKYFDGETGARPSRTMVVDDLGDLYGVTLQGGTHASVSGGAGVIYRYVSADPPAITNVPATNIGINNARLNAMVTPNGADTTVDFFLNGNLVGSTNAGSTGGPSLVSFDATGLTGRTNYTITVRARSRAGTVDSVDNPAINFTTINTPPTAQTRLLHAPAIGAATAVYSAATHTADVDGDTRTLSIASYTGSGTVQVVSGEVIYSNAGFSGTETIQVQVTDGFGGITVGIIILTNVPPVPVGGLVVVGTGDSNTISPAYNSPDSDGDTVALTSFTQGTQVSVGHAAGVFTITAPSGFAGNDSFTITTNDGHGGSTTGTINVQVRDNDAPQITSTPPPQTIQLAPGQTSYTLTDLAADLVATDNIAITGKDQQPVLGASLGVGANPVFFTVRDAAGNVSTASTTITVLGSPLSAEADLLFADAAKPTLLDVLRNDTRTRGGVLTITAVTQGASGSVAIINGKVRYTPTPVLPIAGDTFTYTVTSAGVNATATVRVMPLPAASSQYAGFVLADPDDATTRAGLLALKFSTAGKFTGSLNLGFRKLALTGTMAGASPARVLIKQTGFLPLELYLYASSTTPGAPTLDAQIYAVDGPVRGHLNGTLTRNPFSIGNPAPATGSYTFAAESATKPYTAISTIAVTNVGAASFAGTTPDGVSFTFSGIMQNGGVLPFFTLAGTKNPAALVAELTFSDSPALDRHVSGTMEWRVPTGHLAVPSDSYALTAVGCRYTVKTKPVDMLTLGTTKAVNVFFTDNASTTPAIQRTLATAATITGTAPLTSLTLTAKTGLFNGSYKPGAKAQTFRGVVLQRAQQNRGTGLWLGTTPGAVDLVPVP